MDIVTITGPSLSGKSTLVEKMIFEGSRFARVITCTTRPPREGEKHGVDYYFLTNNEYDQALAEERFVDTTPGSGGNRYGVLRDELERIASLGKIGLIACDPKGPQNIRQYASRHPEVNHLAVYLDLDSRLASSRMEKAINKAIEGQDDLSGVKLRLSRLLPEKSVDTAIIMNEEMLREKFPSRFLPPYGRQKICGFILRGILELAFKKSADSARRKTNDLSYADEHTWKWQFQYDKIYDSRWLELAHKAAINGIANRIDAKRHLKS